MIRACHQNCRLDIHTWHWALFALPLVVVVLLDCLLCKELGVFVLRVELLIEPAFLSKPRIQS